MKKLFIAIALALAGFILWFCWPRHADLRGFDPAVMARIEAASWRHYYEKNWPALFGDLYQGARGQYGFSPCHSCKIALHAARAARVFQPARNCAEADAAIPALVDYFKVIRNGSGETFDVNAAAKQELEWWQLRREGRTWQEFGQAIAVATATVYSQPPTVLEPGSLKRAEMMDLRDRKGRSISGADWREIERGLIEAWTLTKQAIATPDG